MNVLVQINDRRDNVFLHVREVLDALDPDASDLEWTILDLGDSVAVEEPERLDVSALARQVRERDVGLRMTFADLLQLAARFSQVVDGLFIGCRDPANFPRRTDDDQTVLRRADMAVAAFDSTFWLVSVPEPVADRLRRRFAAVIDLDPSQVRLSAWGR